MKKCSLFILGCALAAMTSACAPLGRSAKSESTGARPKWVDGESSRWPRSQYVLGVGSADDENSASDRARGEISRVFSTAVSVDTTVDESESNTTQAGGSSTSFSQLVSQKVHTVSEKILEGVEIVERWRDLSAARSYALAVLDKSKALKTVEDKLQGLDQEALQWNTRMEASTDAFERAKAAAKLVALLNGRASLESDRRILGGAASASNAGLAAAKIAAAKALSALEVLVAVTGDGADELETGVVTGLASAGLNVQRGRSGDKGDLLIEVKSTSQSLDSPDPRWKWSRASATLSLTELRAGKTFARFDVSERQAAAASPEARRRALSVLAEKTSGKISAAIADFIENR